MIDFLVNKFIKNSADVKNNKVREHYGIFVSITGVICNILLFCAKLTIGIFLNSASIIGDSFNNLSDSASNLVVLIGFKMGNKPPDEKHPFGHGRIEYIASLILSMIIILLGYELLKSSYSKIFNPTPINFSFIGIVILLLTVPVKLWLIGFYNKVGNKIDSDVIKAAAIDSKNDVIITLSTIFSIVVIFYTGLNIDSYMGIFVAVMIIKSGIEIANGTLSSLLGESTDFHLAKEIMELISQYDGIVGTHDLIVHNYGPNRSMATIHAEVPSHVPIVISHEVIDRAEKEIAASLGIYLLIHMDPVLLNDERLDLLKKTVLDVIHEKDPCLDAHEFRIADGVEKTNLIFDLSVPHDYKDNTKNKLIQDIQNEISLIDPKYNCIINIESGYISFEN